MEVAIRAVFPTYKVPKQRRAEAGAFLADQAEDDEDGFPPSLLPWQYETEAVQEDDFADVDALLAEGSLEAAVPDEIFEEAELVEVLAATWKEKRQDINDARKTRNFQKADKLQITFRRELEGAKRKTRCRACKQIGH
eukprot:3451241-Pyramimonas_sp.AAC.1